MIQGQVCSANDPEHSEIETYFQPRRPSSFQNFTEIIWAELNWLMQEFSPQQPPPQCDFPSRRSSARLPPQQPCSVFRLTTYMGTEEPKRSDRDKQGEIPIYRFLERRKISRTRCLSG